MSKQDKPRSRIIINGGSITECGTAIHIEDPENTSLETNDLKIDRCDKRITTGIITNRLKPLVDAIKKPNANNCEGWKIMIVGALLTTVLAVIGMASYDFYVKPTLNKTLAPKSKTATSKELK